MARIEDIERRLENWSRWKLGGQSGGMGYARPSLNTESTGARYRQAIIPTSDCEAEETDQAVMALEEELQRTVATWYLEPEGPGPKAALLGIGVPGLYRRIERAHALIDAWLVERERQRVEQRKQVERLQAAARP